METDSPEMHENAEKQFVNIVDNFFEIILNVAAFGSDQLLKVF